MTSNRSSNAEGPWLKATSGKSWAALALLLVLPLVSAFYCALILHLRAPAHSSTFANYDPSYAYLLNSISLLNGSALAFAGHPGLPVILFGALIAPTGAIFSPTSIQSLNQLMLTDPELVLQVIQYGLLATNVLAAVIAGKIIHHATGSILPALLLQATPFLYLDQQFRLMFMNGESLAIGATMLVVSLAIASSLGQSEHHHERRSGYAVAVGILAAVAAVSKITFAPVALLVFIFPNHRSVVISIVALIGTSIALMAPAWHELDNLARWFANIALHQGIYGGGPSGVVDLPKVPANTIALASYFPLGAVIALLSVALFLSEYFKLGSGRNLVDPAKNDLRLFLILLLAIGVQILMVLKHYRPHYAIPSIYLVIGWFIALIQGHTRRNAIGKSTANAIYALALAVIIVSFGVSAPGIVENARIVGIGAQNDVKIFEAAIEKYQDPIIVTTYGSFGKDAALSFGFRYTTLDFARKVLPKDTDSVSYFRNSRYPFRDAKTGWQGPEHLIEKLRAGRTVLYLGPGEMIAKGLRGEVVLESDNSNQHLMVIREE